MKLGLLLFLFLACFNLFSSGQDTIVLLNGKTILAKKVEIGGYSVSYHPFKKEKKQKRLNAETVFSVKHADGSERIVYEPDTLEEGDFNVEQMRMFIIGEQDAMKYYTNSVNKVAAFVCGAGISYFTFYGVVGPAIYSTVVGSFSPDMEKQTVSNELLRHVEEYQAGYQRAVRNNKIKNSILYGLAGFAAGFAAFSVAFKK